jgi:hypothetical protein
MSVITVKRTIRSGGVKLRTNHSSFRDLTRAYFARERNWQLGIEMLLFAIITIISAWPVFLAASALNDFLERNVI